MSFYKMERGWQDSGIFEDAPFDERSAWAWMIGEANWKDKEKPLKGKRVKLERGQLSHSIRFMADKFKWSKDKVHRFLKKLELWDMIQTETATGQNIITICNYSKYQDDRDNVRDRNQTETATGARQERDKEEEISRKKRKKEYTRPADVSESTWKDFLKIRHAKKSPITETAIKRLRAQAEKAHLSLDEALQECCARGWVGFEAEWVRSRAREGPKRGYQGM